MSSMNEIGGWRVKIPPAYYLGFCYSTHAIAVARLASLVELRLLTLARNAKPLIGVLPYAEPYSPDLGELGLGLGFKLSLQCENSVS